MAIDKVVQVYRELAELENRRGAANERDRFLVLAADAALTAGQFDEAERLRSWLLRQNPHHLLKTFASLAEAFRSADVRSYLAEVRLRYPPEVAEQVLLSMRSNEAMPVPMGEALPDNDPNDIFLPLDEKSMESVPPPRPDTPPTAPRKTPKLSVRHPSTTSATLAPSTLPMRPSSPNPRRIWPPLNPTFDSTSTSPADSEDSDLPGGAWVSTLLFGLFLAIALALAFLTLVKPFLP